MRHLFVLTLALAAAAPGTTIAASTIGIYFDLEANVCDGMIPPLAFVDLYVVAKPGPELPDGLTGAEFRIEPFDLDWITTITPNPFSNVAIGNPIAGGCNIAFPSCQAPPSVLLYTIRVLSLTPVSPRILTVLPHSSPSSPLLVCPQLINCSAPIFSRYCVEGLTACVNRDQTCCIIATEASTWTQVKSLYSTGRE